MINQSIPNQPKSLPKLTSNHKVMTAEDIEEEKFTMQEISFNLQDLQNKLVSKKKLFINKKQSFFFNGIIYTKQTIIRCR